MRLLYSLFACIIALSITPVYAARAHHKTPTPSKINTYKTDNLFLKYANHYFDGYYFPANPTLATQYGVHFYDDQLEDYSKEAFAKKIKALREFESNIESFSPSNLSEHMRANREILLNHIRSQLLTLETIRPWEKDPDFYSTGITTAAFNIMERNYASVDKRLADLIAREKLMPQALLEAHKNLINPPEIYTQIALEQMPAITNFFKRDLTQAFSKATNPELKKEFQVTNGRVVQALRDYQVWLKTVMLPSSHGDFRIGADAFKQKLQYDEMVETPLDQLLQIGMNDLRKNQQELNRLAKEIDPNKTTRGVIAELMATHPEPKQLLNKFSGSLDSLVKFIQAKNIITIPAKTRPALEETPPFMRATTFASMDTPGPFEQASKQSYFNVTLPNPAWNAVQVEDFMKSFTYPTIVTTSIHEVYPGHYVQYLWMNRSNDRIRKIINANTNVEGWAHYTEQMMYDQGYGDPNSKSGKLLRVGQLLDALLRDARFIVGIKMHTGAMSFNQAVDFFVNEGYQTHMLGVIEAKRGTADPTYLYYTLGKLQIMKLRTDMQAKLGESFSLQKFHDNFMKEGAVPIKIVRQNMLQDDSPTI